MIDDAQNDIVEYEPPTDEVAEVETPATESTETETQPKQTDDAEQQDEKTPEQKPKSRAEQRIAELVAERNAERQRAAELEAKLNQPQQKTASDGQPVPPNMDDFDLSTDDGLDAWLQAQSDYDTEVERYKIEQVLNERENKQRQAEQQAQIENDFKQAFERNPQFKDNFGRLIQRYAHTPLNIDPSQVFHGQELMGVLDTLATDEELYYELAAMTETQALMRLGEVRATMRMKQNKPDAVVKSNAPKPPTHTSANAPITRSPDNMSMDEFVKWRNSKK